MAMEGYVSASQCAKIQLLSNICCGRPSHSLRLDNLIIILRARPLADGRDHHSNAAMHFLLQLLAGHI